MDEQNTFVKLYRSLPYWRWYQDANTMRVFVHLILKANIQDHDFKNITVHRGEVATSIQSLSQQLKISVRSVRTALEHLKSTNEVTSKIHHQFQVISITNYDLYQSIPTRQTTNKRQAADKPSTSHRQQSKNKRKEEGKNEKIYVCTHTPPSRDEVAAYAKSKGIKTDVDAFIQYNNALGWRVGRTTVEDWRPLLLKWASHDSGMNGFPADDLDEFGKPIKEEFE